MFDTMPRRAEITNQADSGKVVATLPVKRVVGRVPEITHTAETTKLVEPGLLFQFRPKGANRLIPVCAKGIDSDHADGLVHSGWPVDPDRVTTNWLVGCQSLIRLNLRVSAVGQEEGQDH